MGLNETYSNSNETWSAGSSGPKTTMEHHLIAIQSPLMGLWCPTEAIMHFLKFLGLIPLGARFHSVSRAKRTFRWVADHLMTATYKLTNLSQDTPRHIR